MTKRFLITSGVMGTICILMAAIGHHLLKGNISQSDLEMFNLANDFIMYHTLALLAFTAMKSQLSRSYLNSIYYFFVIGIGLFSGSILIKSLQELTGYDGTFLNNFSIIGGILLTIGWIAIILLGLTYKHKYKIRHHDKD